MTILTLSSEMLPSSKNSTRSFLLAEYGRPLTLIQVSTSAPSASTTLPNPVQLPMQAFSISDCKTNCATISLLLNVLLSKALTADLACSCSSNATYTFDDSPSLGSDTTTDSTFPLRAHSSSTNSATFFLFPSSCSISWGIMFCRSSTLSSSSWAVGTVPVTYCSTCRSVSIADGVPGGGGSGSTYPFGLPTINLLPQSSSLSSSSAIVARSSVRISTKAYFPIGSTCAMTVGG
mmetsp:Transcript_10070/g.61213  ORF Transcript_10070/g.61213 Transcript_10070/m.61213 type:complete len:234 (+) Transcript_10070:612-1313(+)